MAIFPCKPTVLMIGNHSSGKFLGNFLVLGEILKSSEMETGWIVFGKFLGSWFCRSKIF